MVKLQADLQIRAVAYDNLVAMCDRASGMAHTYSAELRKTVCELTYSNPDEYGNSRPYTVRLPIVRGGLSTDPENPLILLHVQSESGGEDEYGREACFQSVESEIFSAPTLWRDPTSGEWKTRAEIARQQGKPPEPWRDLSPTLAQILFNELVPAAAAYSARPFMAEGDELESVLKRIRRHWVAEGESV